MGWSVGDKRDGLGNGGRAEPEPAGRGQGGAVASLGRDAAELAPRPRRAEEEEVRRSRLHHRQPQDLQVDPRHPPLRRLPRRPHCPHRQHRPPPPPQTPPSRQLHPRPPQGPHVLQWPTMYVNYQIKKKFPH